MDNVKDIPVMKHTYAVFVGGLVVYVMLWCLQETKLINHKSLKLVQENEQHIREIEEILKKDRRYLVLDYMPDERTKLIVTYLEDLDKRGPPPPPTASEPTRRPTKWTHSKLQPWIHAAERKLGPHFISYEIFNVQKYWDLQVRLKIMFSLVIVISF
jgi:FF domain.